MRVMEKKLSMAKTDDEKKQLQAQMQGVRSASVADAFSSYTMQKSVMYSQMQAMAAPSYAVAYQMPMMVASPGYAMAGYSGYGYGGYA